jgi:uncharacterized protein YjbI with pentapeptide repeats
MTFSELSYYQQKFSKLTLQDASISSKEFEDCSFESCKFTNYTFTGVKFMNCTFSECVLSAISAPRSRFMEVQFNRCKVIGFNWSKTSTARGLIFNDCQLNYSDFSYLKIPEIKIIRCEAKEVDFTGADLSNGSLQNTDFEKSRFYNTNLSGVDFRGARNFYIDVKNNVLKKTRFNFTEAITLLNCLDIIID